MRQVALNNTKGKSSTQSTGKIYYEGNRGCINGQGSNPGVKDLYYGKDTIANNGCELLAVYNAMTLLDLFLKECGKEIIMYKLK